MGDRGNFYCVSRDPERGVYLYGHWSGYNLPLHLRTALQKQWRWNDGEYFARILFDTMTKCAGKETGFGISATMPDNEYPIVVVDCNNQRAGKASPPSARAPQPMPDTWHTFAEIVEMDDDAARAALGESDEDE